MSKFYNSDRLRLFNGDCFEELRAIPDDKIDSIVTDPPYGIAFMGKDWDEEKSIAFDEEFWKECLRVAKPGAHLLAFGATRTYHHLAMAIEKAGWEIRDSLHWVYGCLTPEAEILTPGGWKAHDKIAIGDLVAAVDLDSDAIRWEPIQEVFRYDYKDTAYRISGHSTDHVVSRGHNCVIERDGNLIFSPIEQIARQQQASLPVLENVQGLQEALSSHRESDAFQNKFGPQEIRASRFSTACLVRIEPVEYSGVVWCVSVSSRAFVARQNGKAFVTGNSGFPKSLNVSKAIDKTNGAEFTSEPASGVGFMNAGGDGGYNVTKNKPTLVGDPTDEAKQWEGWGTALKPSHEPVVLARKPLSEKTVVANVLKHGTGALNIDASRIGYVSEKDKQSATFGVSSSGGDLYQGKSTSCKFDGPPKPGNDLGRWPANFLLSHSDECRLVGETTIRGQKDTRKGKGKRKGGFYDVGSESGNGVPAGPIYGDEEASVYECVDDCPVKRLDEHSDVKGGASRFFYVAKPSKSEKNAGVNFCECEDKSWGSEGRNLNTHLETGTQQQRDIIGFTAEADSEWLTMSNGKKPSGKSQRATKSITGIATNKTTQSATSNSSTRSLTKESTEDVSLLMEDGSSHASFAEASCKSPRRTSICQKKDGPNTGSAEGATYEKLLQENRRCVKCGGLNPKSSHPTVKPIKLMEYLCTLVTPPNGWILDPFLGSGTTGIAAMNTGFRFVGIEKEEEYIDIALARILHSLPEESEEAA